MKPFIISSFFFFIVLLTCKNCPDCPDNVENGNHSPIIQKIVLNPPTPLTIRPGNTTAHTQLTAIAIDEDCDSLSYVWEASGGGFDFNTTTNPIDWYGPVGEFTITCTANDGKSTGDLSIDISVEASLPPSMVQVIPKTAESDTLERGIDAAYDSSRPSINSIYFEWYANNVNETAGYSIYRSEVQNGNYSLIANITKNFNVLNTFYFDRTVNLNKRYFYFIRAFDQLNQYGDPSDTITYAVREVPVPLSPVGIITNTSPNFVWHFDQNFIPDNFVFRLLKEIGGVYKNLYTQETSIGDEFVPNQSRNLSELTSFSSLETGSYRWRIDTIGSEPFQGSESEWFDFTIQ